MRLLGFGTADCFSPSEYDAKMPTFFAGLALILMHFSFRPLVICSLGVGFC